jgi:hypothetical protein
MTSPHASQPPIPGPPDPHPVPTPPPPPPEPPRPTPGPTPTPEPVMELAGTAGRAGYCAAADERPGFASLPEEDH